MSLAVHSVVSNQIESAGLLFFFYGVGAVYLLMIIFGDLERYSWGFVFTAFGIAGALFWFYGLDQLHTAPADNAYLFGLGVGVAIGCAVIGYVLTLILFGVGRLLGFIEKAAGVRDEEN